jgi:cytoskeletal protein CcmA (bactofilin family)
MAKTYEVENKLPNMIGSDTKIVGDIETNGDLRIDGVIEGSIQSKGKIVIGTNGSLKGKVKCANAEIAGEINGEICVDELLSLKATSKLVGDIKTAKLSIEPGALFSGNCTMGEKNKPVNPTVQKT